MLLSFSLHYFACLQVGIHSPFPAKAPSPQKVLEACEDETVRKCAGENKMHKTLVVVTDV